MDIPRVFLFTEEEVAIHFSRLTSFFPHRIYVNGLPYLFVEVNTPIGQSLTPDPEYFGDTSIALKFSRNSLSGRCELDVEEDNGKKLNQLFSAVDIRDLLKMMERALRTNFSRQFGGGMSKIMEQLFFGNKTVIKNECVLYVFSNCLASGEAHKNDLPISEAGPIYSISPFLYICDKNGIHVVEDGLLKQFINLNIFANHAPSGICKFANNNDIFFTIPEENLLYSYNLSNGETLNSFRLITGVNETDDQPIQFNSPHSLVTDVNASAFFIVTPNILYSAEEYSSVLDGKKSTPCDGVVKVKIYKEIKNAGYCVNAIIIDRSIFVILDSYLSRLWIIKGKEEPQYLELVDTEKMKDDSDNIDMSDSNNIHNNDDKFNFPQSMCILTQRSQNINENTLLICDSGKNCIREIVLKYNYREFEIISNRIFQQFEEDIFPIHISVSHDERIYCTTTNHSKFNQMKKRQILVVEEQKNTPSI